MLLSKRDIILTVLVIIAAGLAVSLPSAFSSGPCYPDGQRYTFNGILIHDMIRDGEILNPYKYNVKFYSQYPATNLPYGPPFFAFVYAVAFSVFGVSFSVARCVVAGYTVLAALMCWYLLYNINKRYWAALLGAACFLFTSIVGIRARDLGPETAIALHSFLTMFFLYNYVENDRRHFAIYAALALGLGYLTKPYILPLGMSLPLYVIVRKKWHILTKTETWVALFILIVLTVPYTHLSFNYSLENIGIKTCPPLNLDILLGYPKLALQEIPVLTVFSVIGFIIGLYQKSRLILLCLIWAVCWYLFFTVYFGYFIAWDYMTSLVPAMLFPFSIAFYEVVILLKKKHLDKVLIGGMVLWLACSVWASPIFYMKGYEEAGKYVADSQCGKAILFYGEYDGSFMMGVRKRVPVHGPYILRGERCLSERLWFDNELLAQHVKTKEDIVNILMKYRTGCVVVEKNMPFAENNHEYKILNQTVEDEKLFRKLASFPIQSNYSKVGSELAVYNFLLEKSGEKAKTLIVPVPALGTELKVPF
jgi:hypothetical protein